MGGYIIDATRSPEKKTNAEGLKKRGRRGEKGNWARNKRGKSQG